MSRDWGIVSPRKRKYQAIMLPRLMELLMARSFLKRKMSESTEIW
jgi:hypothetical protein